jgi:exonuclease III
MRLSIAAWNVNGITHTLDQVTRDFKTTDPAFIKYIAKHDIFGLLETRVGDQDKICIDGYNTTQISRKKSSNGRFYGGICIAIKKRIADGVVVLKSRGESEYIWVKLDRSFFNIVKDYYVCFVYTSPEKHKNFGIDVYDRVCHDISIYSDKGSCLVIGDMNAHTKLEHDFIKYDADKNDVLQLPDSYIPDTCLTRRNSDTSKVNDHGKALLELCMSTGLCILNGRKFGDIFGSPTFYGH